MIQISLEAARVNAGLTQDAAAERLSVSKQTLINWEKGRSEPSISQARLIESTYGIPLDNIYLPSKSN